MIRSDAFNSNIDPVRTEMTDKKQIQISHVCNSHEKKSTRILAGKNLLQVSSTDERKLENIIVDESFTEDSKSESIQENTNMHGNLKGQVLYGTV